MSVPTSLQKMLTAGPPLRRQVALAGLAAGGAVLVLVGFLILGAVVDKPLRLFSKEPAESLGGAAYTGWLAHLGAIAWLSGAACSLLAGAVLLRSGRGRSAGFLLAAGGYTLLLALDDLFMLHETLYPAFGIREEVMYLAYGILLVALAWCFPAEVGRHGALLLALALAFWGSSAVLDSGKAIIGGPYHLLEDGAKVIGIAMWTIFLVGAAARDLLAALQPQESLLPLVAVEAGPLVV